jgi:hypothetical protein
MTERKVIPFKRPNPDRLGYSDGSSFSIGSVLQNALGRVDRAYRNAINTWGDSSFSELVHEIDCYVAKRTRFTPRRTIEIQKNIFWTWSPEQVVEKLRTSTPKDWEETPIFYRALVEFYQGNRW